MTDATPDRPARPQYGEYATPEQQRAAIRQPNASHALETGQTVNPAPAPAPQPASAGPLAPAPAIALGPEESDRAARRTRLDRIVTYVLLGYGLFTVITRIPVFVDYAGFAASMFSILGVDLELTDPQGAQAWGIAAAVVLGVGWIVTALLSWARLRSGRKAWWVALLGGIVVNLVAGYLLTVPLMSDPAVWPALEKALLGYI